MVVPPPPPTHCTNERTNLPDANGCIGNENEQDDKWLHERSDLIVVVFKDGQNLQQQHQQQKLLCLLFSSNCISHL